jgi:hypothetical protein
VATIPQKPGTGRDKRRHKRGFKSCRVRYGADWADNRAIARRLSVGGLFIATNDVVYPVGTTINMELEIDDVTYEAVGIVRHALKIDSRFARIMRPGMGVEFIETSPGLIEVIQSSW